jgi:hypothetical protein
MHDQEDIWLTVTRTMLSLVHTQEMAMRYTVDQIAADLASWQSTYSDLFKGIYGFRPRGDFFNTARSIAQFMNSYDEEFRLSEERDRQELAALCEEHGHEFASWHDYYAWLEIKDQREHKEWLAEREQQENFQREFARRGSPLPHIIAWEHGDRM